MSRPICWDCGKQLMYVAGKPVFAILVVDGIEHMVHKACAKQDQSDRDAKKKRAHKMFTGRRA